MPAEISVAESSATQVRLSAQSKGVSGTVPAMISDCSRGGIGFISKVYLPPSCRVLVRIPGPGEAIEFILRVQRVRMTDRVPSYYLGAAFDSATPDLNTRIEAFLKAHAQPMEGPRA